MKKEVIIITTAGFVIGLAEALIYYNMGQNKKSGQGFSYKIPPAKELATTAGVVLITSIFTAVLSSGIERAVKQL